MKRLNGFIKLGIVCFILSWIIAFVVIPNLQLAVYDSLSIEDKSLAVTSIQNARVQLMAVGYTAVALTVVATMSLGVGIFKKVNDEKRLQNKGKTASRTNTSR